MATTKQTITAASGWVQVADAAQDFWLDNHGPNSLKVYFGDTPSTAFHELPAPMAGYPASSLVRVAAGDVHVACDGEARIVVSA